MRQAESQREREIIGARLREREPQTGRDWEQASICEKLRLPLKAKRCGKPKATTSKQYRLLCTSGKVFQLWDTWLKVYLHKLIFK